MAGERYGRRGHVKPRKRRDCKKRDELMMKLQEGGQELRGRERRRERVRERHKGRKNTEEEAAKGSKTRERGRK